MAGPKPRLNKRLVASGLQCVKRLYLEVREPDLAAEPDPGNEFLMREGRRIGEAARHLHPEGILVAEADFGDALARTGALLRSGARVLFEAAFTGGGLATRVDILVRGKRNRFDLFEVKSGARVREDHVADVAIQRLALEGAGHSLGGAHVVHLDREYLYEGGSLDHARLFRAEDVTEDSAEAARELAPEVPRLLKVLSRRTPPAIRVGAQCHDPEECPFVDHCGARGPENPISDLYRLTRKLRSRLEEAGIETIEDLPEEFEGLSPLHRRIRAGVHTGKPFLDGRRAQEVLRGARHPLRFLDFETFNPGLPLFPGTHPYDVLPFQWSAHRVSKAGKVDHAGFLHEGREDPRPAFAASLAEALSGDRGTVFIYSPYEKRVLRETAEAVPEHRKALLAIAERAVDLEPVVRECYYHPAQHGSFSLKAVLPAMVPDLGYGDLEIASGGVASAAFADLVEGRHPPEEVARVRTALLRYCARDTEALVGIYRCLADVGSAPRRS